MGVVGAMGILGEREMLIWRKNRVALDWEIRLMANFAALTGNFDSLGRLHHGGSFS